MDGIQISSDEWVFWQSAAWPAVKLNATIVFTWCVMGVLVLVSWSVTRRLTTSTEIPRLQNLLEVLVTGIRNQIREVSGQNPGQYLPFVGTLFLFVGIANLLAIVPAIGRRRGHFQRQPRWQHAYSLRCLCMASRRREFSAT